MFSFEIMPSLKYDLIAFDCDGTLTDSGKQIAHFCNDLNTSGKHYLPLIDLNTPQEVRKVLGATMTEVFTKYGFPQEEIPCLLDLCKRTFSQDSRYISSPFPGVTSLLGSLKQKKVTTGVVTANLLVNITRDLGHSIGDLTEVIDRTILDKKGWKKEDALKWMKRHFRSNSPIYVGDTLRDKESAEKAGWPFVWVAYGWEIPPEGYQYTVNSVDNLVQLIGI